MNFFTLKSFQTCMTLFLLPNKIMYSIFRQFSVFFVNIIKVCGNRNSLIDNILQNISFCVSQKTENHTSLDWHDGE